jgi:hypothetical protein
MGGGTNGKSNLDLVCQELGIRLESLKAYAFSNILGTYF